MKKKPVIIHSNHNRNKVNDDLQKFAKQNTTLRGVHLMF